MIDYDPLPHPDPRSRNAHVDSGYATVGGIAGDEPGVACAGDDVGIGGDGPRPRLLILETSSSATVRLPSFQKPCAGLIEQGKRLLGHRSTHREGERSAT